MYIKVGFTKAKNERRKNPHALLNHILTSDMTEIIEELTRNDEYCYFGQEAISIFLMT